MPKVPAPSKTVKTLPTLHETILLFWVLKFNRKVLCTYHQVPPELIKIVLNYLHVYFMYQIPHAISQLYFFNYFFPKF